MRKNKSYLLLLSVFVLTMASCSLNKYVPEGKYLVKKNVVTIVNDSTGINKSKLSNYISLKPYKESLDSDFPFWIYYKAQSNPDSKLWKWLNNTMGKEPSYYEKTDANYSSKQMALYLGNIGYPNSKVKNSITAKRHKVTVTYAITPSQPYRINKIDYIIEDSAIARYLKRREAIFPVKVGDIYNAYTMNEQRELITEQLKNTGYYFFNRDNIHYDVDSNFMNHTMNVTMKIAHNELASRRYFINNISIYPNFSLNKTLDSPSDTITLTTEVGRRKIQNKLNFYYFGKPNVRPETIEQAINILKGSPYRQQNVSLTYNGISNYQIFSNPNIEFDTIPNDSLNLLDCKITMQQNDTHSFTAQAEGTNSDGDLGIKGSLSLTNRNIFHGSEVFQLSLKAGLEAQTINLEETKSVFNTKEIGITGNLMFPRFISPIPFRDFARDCQPTTNVTLGFNTQIRYYYSRYIATASYSYDWKSNKRYMHTLTPVFLNTVKISNMKPEFVQLLEQEHNQRKKDQYTSHLLLGLKYSFVMNTQDIKNQNSFIYFRTDIETSGNLISLFNDTKLVTLSDEYNHELFGIRYAQYIRTSFDFRQHINLKENHWLVFREFLGLGIPYGNSKDLPFERSFYAGGTSSLRGWNYRGVGPGGCIPDELDIEKIGDLQLEANFEYRFPIYNIFNGAVFVDAGNVWTYWPSNELLYSEFRFDQFYKQIAVDAGIGVRLDLSFLIVRVDLARALRNPYPNANGHYWRFDFDETYEFGWRLVAGIGYPF